MVFFLRLLRLFVAKVLIGHLRCRCFGDRSVAAPWFFADDTEVVPPAEQAGI
jgi:hypothetical protein